MRKWAPYLAIALCIHILALAFSISDYKSGKNRSKSKSKPMVVKNIDREQLQKYRTAGIKNGSKKFTMKLPSPQAPSFPSKKAAPPPPKKQVIKTKPKNVKKSSKKSLKKSKRKTKSTSKAKKSRQRKSNRYIKKKRKKVVRKKDGTKPLSLAQLKASKKNYAPLNRNRPSKNIEGVGDLSELENKKLIKTSSPNMRQRMLKDLRVSEDSRRLLKKTGFNVMFEPPEGVKVDALNSAEKIYYIFQKRTFLKYINSFIKTFNTLSLQRPSLEKEVRGGNHMLMGKIRFDKLGNIVSIKILKSTRSDDIHRLFEETLKEIRKLPNPPKDFVKTKDHFTIYYQLKIN